jgi:copper chaperone CopZ
MANHVFQVQGMTCGHCAMHIRKELLALPGVTDTVVNVTQGTVTVTHDGQVDVRSVEAAIEEAGYRVVKS